jgi:ABC-2 type transport system ATP-binding protein
MHQIDPKLLVKSHVKSIPMRGAPAISVKGLTKRFGKFIAVNDINLEIEKGKVFGFLGPNGAGKSTIIRMLCGILEPTAGIGQVAGYNMYTQGEAIKNVIGYMSQKFSLYEDLTVMENIDFYSGIYCVEANKKDARKAWVLEMAGLKDQVDTKTALLPGGWKQRLALGCAVLHEPSLIFLDEPTAGVDPISRRKFWTLIDQLAASGVTIIVTTHYMDEAEYFDQIALIYRGVVIAEGSPEELKRDAMPEKILEVFCSNTQEAIPHLRSLTGVREVELFGNGLHLVVSDADKVSAEIPLVLNKAGIKLKSLDRITSSMEDVFVSLIEKYDKDERPLAEVAR